MDAPKLTIGMAHYDDFHGLYFTVQALRMYTPDVNLKQVQLVIVNNSPKTPHGVAVAGLVPMVEKGFHSVKHVVMGGLVGTTPSRERIFAEADGEAVLVMDCHVMLKPHALRSLLNYYEDNPETRDIISGPMLYDDLGNYTTHFDDVWRAEMWGIWGAAWECPCQQFNFSVHNYDGKTQAVELAMGSTPVDACPNCSHPTPKFEWKGHETQFILGGYRRRGHSYDDPFEIPGMGLGLFSCRREAWLGFNPHSRGFGGEELYIHGKFRAAGHKAICLPQLTWLHRFGRPDGVKYPLTLWNKVRNYVLEFQELGWDVGPIRKHFVEDLKKIKPDAFDLLVSNPVQYLTEPSCQTCGGSQKISAEIAVLPTTEDILRRVESTPRDLDKHVKTLRGFASVVKTVTEFSGRAESTVALAAPTLKSFTSYNTEVNGMVLKYRELLAREAPTMVSKFVLADSPQIKEIEPTDLLFLDTDHTEERVSEELIKFGHQVNRFIILHDTDIFGLNAPNRSGGGVLYAVAEFLRDNPEWDVVSHSKEQYGLTVLARNAGDKPPLLPAILPSQGKGAGTEMTKILASAGINPPEGCVCHARADTMDAWGVQGCEHRKAAIVVWMRDAATRFKWDWMKIFNVVKSGLAFQVNPLDPIPSIVQLAINKAAEAEKAGA